MSAFDAQLENLKSPVPAPPEPDCPDANVWREIAVALMPSDQALAHLQHASRCDHCGPLLRIAISDMDGSLTKSEAKQIAALESARPEWQQRLASRITGTPVPPAPLPWWKAWASAPRLAFAGLGLVAVIGVGSWIALRQARPTTPNDLLATAYSEQRTLELRIPGAVYAPIRVQKGAEGSFLSRPAALLKAEFIIATQISSHPSDPNWLQAKARADLLEGKYDSAVDALRHALQIAPKSPSLLIDLGTAYFQRALMADRQEDFGAAYESLSQALASQPDNGVALFNRAIVAEQQFLFHQALDDWDHYLRVDPGSEWAGEARQRADTLRNKLKKHDQSHAAPLLTPSQIAAQVNDPNLRAQVDQRVEEYLHEAVVSWLPQAYPDNRGTPDSGARQALFFLADLTSQQHGDRWLTDLLAQSSSPDFSKAVLALAAALTSNAAADYDNSARQADSAARLFGASRNRAGVLHAKFEQAFSNQQRRNTAECRRQASLSLAEAARLHYSWLRIQFGLEKAVCSLLGESDWGGDEELSRQAMGHAKESNYLALYVRALYFLADDQVRSGDFSTGLKSTATGLKAYWSAQLPGYLGYNLYHVLGSVPEFTADRPRVTMAVWREATTLSDSFHNPLQRAWAHSFAARAAAVGHEPETAQREYLEAARLFTLVPKTEATRDYILWNEIHTAGAEARVGQFESGIARLTRIQDQLRTRSDKNLEETFYATLGELELRSQHAIQAEQAFHSAMESAERRLLSLNSESDRINWSKDAAAIYLGMTEAELVQGHIEQSLSYFEWYLGAPSRSRKSNRSAAAPDPAWLASRLPLLNTQTVLAYAALPDGLAIWSYDNRGVHALLFPESTQNLRELAARFDNLASDPGSDIAALRRDSQLLYHALIAPLEPQLESNRSLAIEAEGWLARVPFEALWDSSGHYLIERIPIVHSLGLAADSGFHGRGSISPDLHALVVASTAASQNEGLLPLPEVAAEADAVARNFPSHDVLKASAATFSAIEQALPEASVFHYSGHSLAGPKGTALLLQAGTTQAGAPSLLTADALRRMDWSHLQLAVLSTCNTDSRNTGSGGANGIAEALQRAGVPHVVATRWAVDSVEARKFVESFYRNALSGQSVSEAVRQTSRSMMADTRTAHPYYWSAFSAYGRP